MTQTIQRAGVFNLNLLMEEIIAEAPELIEGVGEDRTALFQLTYDGQTLTGHFPDDFQLSRLVSVANAHVPSGESVSQVETRRSGELRPVIRNKFIALGFTLEELKFIKQALD